ncbi:MAG: dTDP-4-dehydrorhamnose reductase [Actinomycetota bacterium]|nr:dTDP-4-dehydrorhamnose reductase [Actinomycetota bacterium]
MKVLVTGAAGQVGRDLVDVLSQLSDNDHLVSGAVVARGGEGALAGRNIAVEVIPADRSVLDVTVREGVRRLLGELQPDVVIHAAAWTDVDGCEADPDRAFLVNALGTRNVAEAANDVGAHVCYISTDYVFDGRSQTPYVEWDDPHPLSVYGRSKRGGERELFPGSTTVRTSWVCGVHGKNVVRTVLDAASRGKSMRFVDDQHGCPTFSADLSWMLARLAIERRPGIFHVTNQGATTWFGFARAVLEAAGRDPALVEPISTSQLDPPRPAPRPRYSILDNAALRLSGIPLLADWREPLVRVVGLLGG